MAIDRTKIIEKAKESDNKVRFTITLSPGLLREFREDCDRNKASYSAIIEELIKDFLYPDPSKSKKK